jgi:tight adherence protein B
MSKKKAGKNEQQYVLSATNREMINYCVYKMSFNEKLLYFLLAFVIGAGVAYLFYGGIGKDDYGNPTMITYILDITIMTVVGLAAGRFFLPIRKEQIIDSRKKRLRRQFIDLLDSLASSISSGKNVPNAFQAAREDLLVQYQPDAYIIQEVDNIISGIRNNVDVGSMLRNFGERSGIQDIRTFGRVFETAHAKGANLKDVVRNSHMILSNKCEIEAEIETKVASNKNEQNIMIIMPIILVGMIKLAGADFAKNFTTPSGILCTTIAIASFVGAYILGRKILKIEV